MPAVSVNRALDSIAFVADAPLTFIQKVGRSEWSVVPISATLPSFLMSYAKTSKNAREFLEYVAEHAPPNTELEQREWKNALFHCVNQAQSNEQNFVVFWNTCQSFLDESDRFNLMTRVLCRGGDPWNAAVDLITTTSTCDWNRPVPDILFKPDKADMYMSGQQFKRGEAHFLLLARSKEAVMSLVKAGVQVDQAVRGKTLRQRMVDRSVESFAGADQRKSALSWIEREVPREWNQATAWEAITSSRQAADIDRVLVACKKDWPNWRGPMGETMAHHIAMYAPAQMTKVFKRPEVPDNITQEKDRHGLDLRAWWVAGMGRESSSLATTHCDLSKLPKFTRPQTVEEAAKLSVEAFLVAFNPDFAVYGVDINGRYRKQDYFRSMRNQSEQLGLAAMPMPESKDGANRGRYASTEDRNREYAKHNVAKDKLVLELLSKNEWDGTPAPEGWRDLMAGALTMCVRAHSTDVQRGYGGYGQKEKKPWMRWGEALCAAPSHTLSPAMEKWAGEYLAWSMLRASIETKVFKCEGRDWTRAIESGVNPHDMFALLEPNTQKQLMELGWEERAIAPWERKKLQDRANERMSNQANKPASYDAL
jgi:hypothetical protein